MLGSEKALTRCSGWSRVVQALGKRKSVGAEVNWGVRFATDDEAAAFLEKLAGK